jgi:DNA-binding phage protein
MIEWTDVLVHSVEREDEDGMALTVDYRETVTNRIKEDPEFARRVLDQAASMLINGAAAEARLMLRDLAHALGGFESLAQATGTPPKSLHRALSVRGNPTMNTLSGIFRAITEQVVRGQATVHVEQA